MHNLRLSFISLTSGAVGVLLVVYIGLIAVVMSYAALTVEFSQSVKNDEAAVAVLEAHYLASVASVTDTNYLAEGYAAPSAQLFVPARSVTALR
ncbi:MAG TPA: hypothetical protein PLW99_02145 [Candidatus Paceibacterota bacterium]|nr:MAG: hypothetical protein B7X03_00205 [Parcubacteria group bacterium 21-58-10]HQT82931.1 hypothetical protein [Candidatus Paceibacterota bacterium]